MKQAMVALIEDKYYPVLIVEETERSIIGLDYNDLVYRLFDKATICVRVPYEKIYGRKTEA